MTKDKAAKVITKEINTRAKLNAADKYLQTKKEKEEFVEKIKNHSIEEFKTILKRLMQYITMKDYTSNQSTRSIDGIDKMTKDKAAKVITKEINTRSKLNKAD